MFKPYVKPSILCWPKLISAGKSFHTIINHDKCDKHEICGKSFHTIINHDKCDKHEICGLAYRLERGRLKSIYIRLYFNTIEVFSLGCRANKEVKPR